MLEKPPGENSSKENEEDKPYIYIYDIRETAYDARMDWQMLKRGRIVILEVFRFATLDSMVDV